MRFFFTILLLISCALLLAGLGHYLVLQNLSQLLGKEPPSLDWELTRESLEIKTGGWTEVVNLKPPFALVSVAGGWRIRGEMGSINLNLKPHFKIYWEDSNGEGRKFIINGE